MKDKKADGNSQHEFTKEQSYQQELKRKEVKRELKIQTPIFKSRVLYYRKSTKWSRRNNNKKGTQGDACNSEPQSMKVFAQSAGSFYSCKMY